MLKINFIVITIASPLRCRRIIFMYPFLRGFLKVTFLAKLYLKPFADLIIHFCRLLLINITMSMAEIV